jgi:hypothetical protein
MMPRIDLFAEHEREDRRIKIDNPLLGLTKHVDFDALARCGQIVDASLVQATVQHNKREEAHTVGEGMMKLVQVGSAAGAPARHAGFHRHGTERRAHRWPRHRKDAPGDGHGRVGDRTTSMPHIAQAADMSCAPLYLHFKNKEEVFRAGSERARATAMAQMAAALAERRDYLERAGHAGGSNEWHQAHARSSGGSAPGHSAAHALAGRGAAAHVSRQALMRSRAKAVTARFSAQSSSARRSYSHRGGPS